MTARKNRLLAALVAVALPAAAVAVASSAYAATTPPPFEPDPNAVGTLSFYDASGNQITSGRSDTAPFAAYVAGSAPIRSGDTTAALFYAAPDPNKTTTGYFKAAVGIYTPYPTSTAPASVNTISQTRPVNTGDPSDLSLDDFRSQLSSPSTATGYDQVVQIRMRTSNSAGQSGLPYDEASVVINPTTHIWTQVYPTPPTTTVPGAPTGVSATPGNAQATVSWTAPANTGGSAITGYQVEYSSNGGTSFSTATTTATSSPYTVTGLTNGTAYVFRVSAINSVGTGPASANSASVTPTVPATAPDAPTNVSATAGSGQAVVTWTAPANTGGAAITGYKVEYSSNGGTSYSTFPTTGTATTATVTGLTNGTAYVFRVSATNSAGTSAPSAASNSVTPLSVPGSPTNVSATAGDAQAVVSWTAPTNNGGSPITGYRVDYSSDNGANFATFPTTGTATIATVTGLTNGTAYVFRVAAITSVGGGLPSANSAPVTPRAPAAPGAPTNVTATAGNAQATVQWTAPADPGTSPITGYKVDYAVSGTSTFTTAIPSTTGTSYTVTGLTNNTSYVFRVSAINAVGTGSPSAPSAPVTPKPVTAPGAPGNVVATASNSAATVTWTAPASNGGSPITGYKVTYTRAGGTPVDVPTSGTATSATATNLINGATYTFQVSAINAVGTGEPASSNAVTPSATDTVLAIGAPTQVQYNSTIVIAAKLVDEPTRGPLGGRTITLYGRTDDTDNFAPVTSIKTTSKGTAAVAVRAVENEEFIWRFEGDTRFAASISGDTTVLVQQVVSFHATPTTVKRGSVVVFYGAVAPQIVNRGLYLQQFVNGQWQTVHYSIVKKLTLVTGQTVVGYQIGVRLTSPGAFTFRIEKPDSDNRVGVDTPGITVRAT